MLSIFGCPKGFDDPHIAVIQTNAIQSWLHLDPNVQVILLGDDPGVADAAQHFGVEHIPGITLTASGRPMYDSLFATARNVARHTLLAYVNADILLPPGFLHVIRRVDHELDVWMLTGQRWNLDLDTLVDYSNKEWVDTLRSQAARSGFVQPVWSMDYFVFTAPLYANVPPFVLGAQLTDIWMVYAARMMGAAVVDATLEVTAFHQNHDFAHYTGGVRSRHDTTAKINEQLANQEGMNRMYTLLDGTHQLNDNRLVPISALDSSESLSLKAYRRMVRANIPVDPVWRAYRRQILAASYWYEGQLALEERRLLKAIASTAASWLTAPQIYSLNRVLGGLAKKIYFRS